MKLAVFSGILAIIAFLPPQFIKSSLATGGPFKYSFIFGFFCLVPFFVFLKNENRFWRLILGTFIFRLIFGLGTVYYTIEPFFWSSSALIFLGLASTVFLVKKAKMPVWIFFASLPVIWTAWDILEAQFSLLPTYIITLGNSLGSSPFLGLASFGGLITLTLFAAAINAILAATITAPRLTKKTIAVSLGILLIIISDALAISNLLLKKNADNYNTLKNSLKITAVSTNENFNLGQFNQLKNELKQKKSDLIVLPEDILNNSVGYSFFQNLASELKSNIATTLTIPTENGRYNSTVLFGANGEILGRHDKNRLTFLGEYWPFGDWHPKIFDRIKENEPEYGDYAMFNPRNQYIKGKKDVIGLEQTRFASLICLETDYPFDLKTYKNMGADFLINPSSNRWINNLGKNEFIYLTANLKKIESVWLKIPIVSAGVKDHAGIIYPDGTANLIPDSYKKKNYSVFEGEIKI